MTVPGLITLTKLMAAYHTAFDFLCNNGFPDTLIEICREGFEKSGDNLCAFLPFVWQEYDQADNESKDDVFPLEKMIGDVPCWAFDMHVREGNQGMSLFLKSDCETARWINANVPSSRRRRFLGNILFCVESGLVASRLQWGVGSNLRHIADYQCHGIDSSDVSEVMELLRQDLKLLNKVRQHVAESA